MFKTKTAHNGMTRRHSDILMAPEEDTLSLSSLGEGSIRESAGIMTNG